MFQGMSPQLLQMMMAQGQGQNQSGGATGFTSPGNAAPQISVQRTQGGNTGAMPSPGQGMSTAGVTQPQQGGIFSQMAQNPLMAQMMQNPQNQMAMKAQLQQSQQPQQPPATGGNPMQQLPWQQGYTSQPLNASQQAMPMQGPQQPQGAPGFMQYLQQMMGNGGQ